jgi:signal transduction histidine kinase
MAEPKEAPKSSLRNNIMIVFVLAVILLGTSMTAMSHHILRRALLQSDVPSESVQAIGRQFTQMLTGFTIAGIVIAILIAALLSRTITEPIRRLLVAVAKIGGGQLSTHIDVAGDDELGQLAQAFNDMAQKLKHSHDQLETTVEERTAELTDANQNLQTQIAERWRAEAGLRDSLSLLEAALESTADGILVTQGTGKIKSFNKQFKNLWRIPDAVLESKDDDEALAFVLNQLCDPKAFVDKVKELYRQPEKESFDILPFLDGRVFERYSKPQIIGKQIVGRVWSFRDITEQHRAQEEQGKLLRRVEEINEELTHFAYVVSHDLKAPLRGIKLLTDWLRTDCGEQLGDEGEENLRLLQSRVDRMHNLIEGVLQYSRVGRIKEERIEVDLDVLVPSIIDAIAPPEHVSITVEGPLPTVVVEHTRITQVFQNLLTNAVKYMDKPAGQIAVACTDQDDAWMFSISDNGPGIDGRHFDRIFKIFQTLAPRDEFESTGVGLTLVKKIVELYGGSVWVESEIGQGSTFFFTLPKARAETEEKEAVAGVGACSGPPAALARPGRPRDNQLGRNT